MKQLSLQNECDLHIGTFISLRYPTRPVSPFFYASFSLVRCCAYQLLHRAARVQRGQRVLVHGAAGAVGEPQLALGRLAGLELWGAARGEHAALIRELGATPIDYRREDFTRALPGGFDVVFDGGRWCGDCTPPSDVP